jgi:hypothetical protein
MSKKLYHGNVSRLFSFGCSFTQWFWPTWPEIIAHDMDVPLWNYGKPGAGNQFIFNQLMQADSLHGFGPDDLIIVCWTNVTREDRFDGQNWITPGNIYTQSTYEKSYVDRWAIPEWYLLRDFATIKSADIFLQNCKAQSHMLSMCDLAKNIDQFEDRKIDILDSVMAMYADSLARIETSFYDVLWQGNQQDDPELMAIGVDDPHPMPRYHLEYLSAIFDHQWTQSTLSTVQRMQELTIDMLASAKKKRPYDVPNIKSTTSIRTSEPRLTFW